MLNTKRQLTDEELVERIKDGDADCLDILVETHLPKMHNRIHNLVPESDADDVTQDVFIGLIDSIPNFEGRSAFSTWFHRIAMNKVADYHRKIARRREDIDDELSMRIFSPWEETDDVLIVEQVLRAIPQKYKDILILRCSEGLSFNEIADKLNLSYEATRSRYRRALILVRKKIKDSQKK
jgi:RNA polymerase sigma factor (sigma-70 family)